MHLKRWCKTIAISIAVLVFIMAPKSSVAQSAAGGSVTGTVVDIHGSAIQKAAVSLKGEQNNVSQQLVTDGQGHFAVTNLSPGKYDLTVTAPGFQDMTKSGIAVSAGQVHKLPAGTFGARGLRECSA